MEVILEALSVGEKIARESSRAVDRFGRYSEKQLRDLQRLYLDARLNIQMQIVDKYPTGLTGDVTQLVPGAVRLRRLDAAIALEMETLKAQVNKEIPQIIDTAGKMGVTQGQGELASMMKTFPDLRPSFTLPNYDAIRVYSDYALQLSDSYIDETRRQIQAALRQGLIEGRTVGQLTTQIRQYMGAEYGKPNTALTYKSQRIARTEMARAYAQGHTAYGKSTDWVIGERWHFTFMGPWPCAQCESVAVENEDFYYKDGGPPNLPVHPQSYSEDTEVYTDRGWVFFKDLKNDEQILSLNPDTFGLEWLPSLGKIAYPFSGKIYHLQNKWFSLKVTPGHQQLFGIRSDPVDRKKITWKIDSVENMVKRGEFRIPRTANWNGESPEFININGLEIKSDDFCRFMGYFLSEGSVIRIREKSCRISIAQGSQEGLDKIYNDISGIPVKFYKGKENIQCSNRKLGEYLFQFGKSFEKFIPDEIKILSSELIKVFLLAYNFGDGSTRITYWKEKGISSREYTFSTSSPKMAGDLGEMILRAGGYPSYSIMKTAGKLQKFKNGIYRIKNDQHVMAWNKSKTAVFEKSQDRVNLIDYDGMVYDVTLPKNHILWVRQNGKTCFSGNCRCYTTFLYKENLFTQAEIDRFKIPVAGEGKFGFMPATSKESATNFALRNLVVKGGSVDFQGIPLRNMNLINRNLDNMVRQYKTKTGFIGSNKGYAKYFQQQKGVNFPHFDDNVIAFYQPSQSGLSKDAALVFNEKYWANSKTMETTLKNMAGKNFVKNGGMNKMMIDAVNHEYGHAMNYQTPSNLNRKFADITEKYVEKDIVARYGVKPGPIFYKDEMANYIGTYGTRNLDEQWGVSFALYQRDDLIAPDWIRKAVEKVLRDENYIP